MQDRILGAVALALAAAMAWEARDYAAPIAYEPVGPRTVPLLLAALIALIGLWLLVRGGGRGVAAGTAERPAAPAVTGRPLLPPRVVAAAAAIVVYAALFDALGFVLATVVMTVPVAWLFGGGARQGLVVGVGFGVGFYLLFDRVLDVVLPAGLLRGLLG